MGQGPSKVPSKGELLYRQVSYGNTEVIQALHREGADLEWLDRDGKTPLIVACMNHELYDVAKTLIELGANVNAYRPGCHAGTPLHHATKRSLESIVKLLLLHGANPLVMNDDCQTALDVARAKGYSNVVRVIENHLHLFTGWLREFGGPEFLEVVGYCWVVVLPVGSRNSPRPDNLELAIYSSLQDAQPRTVIALWNATLEEPKLHQSDPSVTIVDNTAETRIKFARASENDKQQLKRFSDACKGMPQANSAILHEDRPGGNSSPTHDNIDPTASGSLNLIPTAPPIADETPVDGHGPIHYPSVDLSPVDISSPVTEKLPTEKEQNAVGSSSSCVICSDAPAKGACVRCGHVAGCISCLNEVKAKKWGCPVCRAEINQVIRLYYV